MTIIILIMRLLKTLLLSQLFVVGLTFAQESSSGNYPEILDERDMFSNTYMNLNGNREKVISAGPVNYFVNGEWKSINTEIILRGGDYINSSNLIKTTFPGQVGSNEWITLDYEGDVLSMSTVKTQVLYNEQSGITLFESWDNASASSNDNFLNYNNVVSGINDQYEISNIGVKNNVILDQVPSILGNSVNGYYGYQEEFVLPQGWTLNYYADAETGLIGSEILITDEFNEPALMIDAPVFYDDNGLTDGGTHVEGKYLIEEFQGVYKLTTLVPTNWLTDPTRTYPVTLDPSVILAGNTGGWQSQNNYVNNPGYVFIGVCCGNLEHRAWLKWDVSSIPDNACVTQVDLQVYVNGVGATTSELVHAYDMMATTSTGLFGPYPGIMPTVYADMGNGWYTSFTLTGTGYYGWYNLGANACTDVMDMMNSYDWYQVALIFDNEPSTNWKRLTAGLCSLRITYDDPPCVILPVELSAFEAECQEDKTKLTWTTLSENLSDHFTVWRSFDGEDFEPIMDVDAAGTSLEELNYEVYDDTRGSEMAYYKLSQTDLDGQTVFFNAVSFNGCDLKESQVFADPSGNVHVNGVDIEYVILSDHLGRKITQIHNKQEKASIIFDPSVDLGTYIVTILHKNGKKESRKLFLK